MANKKRDGQLIRIYSGPANINKIFQNQIQEKIKRKWQTKGGTIRIVKIYSRPANLKKIFQNQIQEKMKRKWQKKEGRSVNQDIFRSSKCPVKSFHYQLGVQWTFLRLVSVLSTNILEH